MAGIDRPSHLADLARFFGLVIIGERRSLKDRRDRQQNPRRILEDVSARAMPSSTVRLPR
jgi:hypothetical protein